MGVAGDLFVDGAIGSRTACLCAPYADAPDTVGSGIPRRRRDRRARRGRDARPGMQAGFHVIGDAASDAVVDRPATRDGTRGTAGDACRHAPARARRAAHRRPCAGTRGARRHGQHAADVRRAVGRSRRDVRAAPGSRPGRGHEPLRRPRVRRSARGLRLGRPRHRPRAVGGRACRGAPHESRPGAVHPRCVRRAHPERLAGHRPAGVRHPRPGSPGAPRGLGSRRHRRAGAGRARGRMVHRPPIRARRDCRRSGPTCPCPRCLRTIVHGRTVFDSGELDPS